MLEIRLLGQYDVRRRGKRIEIAPRPARLLFAYLVLTAPIDHPREKVAGLLWPNSNETNARRNLRQALWRLRRTLGEDWVRVSKDTIGFKVQSGYWSDVATLAGSSPGTLTASVAAYGGELMPGYYEEWVLLERERLRAAYERQMQRLLDSLLQNHDWSDALHWAEQWIAVGHSPEPAFRAAMMAHAGIGDKAAVAATYERCLSALRQDLGVDPSTETQQLYLELQHKATPEPLSTARAGNHRPAAPPSNLPQQSTPFIGRDRELAQISQLLRATRLLTVVGPGGVGKTRLALEAAARCASDYPDGSFLVSLAPVEKTEQVVQAISEAIGFPLSSHESPRHQLIRHLRHRRYLLLLDSFEHLLPAAELMSDILRTAPHVSLLLTSREPLSLHEETLFRVHGLEYPGSPDSPDPGQYGAVQLFLQTAGRLRPGFALTADQAPSIARICQLLAGMPLGILLAAAWIDQLTPLEIAAEITRSLDFLQVNWRDMPSRHHSIRAIFDSSWRLLTPAQQELFSALAVFRGSFSREAAEQVASADLPGLRELVSQSLLKRDFDSGRYALHELLRQFALERLHDRPQRKQKVFKAHATFYSRLIEELWLSLIGARQQQALVRFEADLANLRAAWRYWLEQGDPRRIAMFVDAFWRAYDMHGWFKTGEELFAEAVESFAQAASDRADDATSVVYARLLSHQSYFLTQIGYSDRGRSAAQESVDALLHRKRTEDLAIALDALRWSSQYLEDPLQATEAYRTSIEFSPDHEGRWKRAYSRCWQGVAAAWHGERKLARRYLEESLSLFEILQDRLAAAWPRLELGHLAAKYGDYEEAETRFSQILDEAREIGFDWAATKAARYLGNVATLQGDYRQARKHMTASLRLAEKLGMIRDVVSCLYDIALLESIAGDLDLAVCWLTIVRRHPLSGQTRTFSVWLGEEEPQIRPLADKLLEQLRNRMPPDQFSAAKALGHRSELDVIVHQLLN